MIQVTCPGCGKSLQAPDSFAGKRAKCKSCGTATLIGVGADAVVEDLVEVVEPEEIAAVPASRVDNDEEERRPRRRDRSREDDDVDEDEAPRDRPRRRRKRRPSSGGNGVPVGVIIACIALVFLILLGGGGYAAWHYLNKDSGPLAAERKYLPDSLSSFSVYQFDVVKSRPAFEAVRKCSNYQTEFWFAVTPGGKDLDVVRAVVVKDPFELAILTMRNSVTIKDLIDDNAQVTESKEHGNTVYVVNNKGYYIDGKRVLIGAPNWVHHILELPSEMPIPDKMQKAMAQADFSKPEVHFETFDKADRQPGPGFVNPFGEPPLAMVGEIDYQSPVGFQLKFLCKDAATAGRLADLFRSPLVQKSLGPLRGATVDVADANIVLHLSVNTSDVCGMLR